MWDEGVKERMGKEARAREMDRRWRERTTESNNSSNPAGQSLSSACALRASRLRFVGTRRIASLFRLNALSLPISSVSVPPFPCVCHQCLRRRATRVAHAHCRESWALTVKDEGKHEAKLQHKGHRARTRTSPYLLRRDTRSCRAPLPAHLLRPFPCDAILATLQFPPFPARSHHRPEWLRFLHIRKS